MSKKGPRLDYDEVLDHLGQFGKHSIMVFCLACYVALWCGPPVTEDTFVGHEIAYRPVAAAGAWGLMLGWRLMLPLTGLLLMFPLWRNFA